MKYMLYTTLTLYNIYDLKDIFKMKYFYREI